MSDNAFRLRGTLLESLCDGNNGWLERLCGSDKPCGYVGVGLIGRPGERRYPSAWDISPGVAT